jgi:hypothetical protein
VLFRSVSKSEETYNVSTVEGSTSNGTGYQSGDQITILGTSVGGLSPDNDIVIVIQQVDSDGSILVFSASGVASEGDASFTEVTGTNTLPPGENAIFEVTRTTGAYSVSITAPGNNYRAGNRVLILGTSLDGVSPDNDAVITINSIGVAGTITSATISGTTYRGDILTVYPVITLSDPLIGTLADGTLLSVGAIATIQVDFESNHGIVPGTTMFNQITSNPPPDFISTDRTLPSSGSWLGVAFAEGYFVAIRGSSNATAISTDGVTWTAGGNLPSSTTWTSVAGEK